MANKVIGDYTAAGSIDGLTHYLLIQPGGSSTAYNRINRNTYLGITGSPVGTSDTQVLTNKTIGNTNTVTLKDTLFTLQDDSDTTKQAQFQLSGITTATTRTYTLPNASSTLADISTAQTLTNKTLTSPAITGGTIDNSTITVDSIAGHTASTTGTIYGVAVTAGVIATASTVNGSALVNTTVTASKLSTGASTSSVTTAETTTSTTFVGLATAQTVTITVGVNGLLLVSIAHQGSSSLADNITYSSFALSGANTLASSFANAVQSRLTTATASQRMGFTKLLTGLTPGSTTVTMQFAVSAGTATFSNRDLTVVPL